MLGNGWRRFVDWFDWIHPKGWAYEHNVLHPCHTGEQTDPDLVERETAYLQASRLPACLKYVILFLVGVSWKFTFYAPSTTSVINPEDGKRVASRHLDYISILDLFRLRDVRVRRLWMSSYLPYSIWHFGVIPLLFFPLGEWASMFVLVNKLQAEMFANFHTFAIVGPNHTGEDLYRFGTHPRSRDDFYAAQVLGSVNYNCGGFWLDYSQMWYNYQIEHHLFPDVPMRQYAQLQPRVQALCERYGLDYRQESVFKRFWMMVEVFVGRACQTELRELRDWVADSQQGVPEHVETLQAGAD